MFQEQKNSLVLIKSAVKNSRKEDPKEILVYEKENATDEVVGETTSVEEIQEEVNSDSEVAEDTAEEKEESK